MVYVHEQQLERQHSCHSGGFLALVIAISGLLIAPLVIAQEDENGDKFFIEDIMVTAERDQETQAEAADTATTFTAEEIEQKQIDSVSDLQLSTPNLTFTQDGFTNSNLQIRGVGTIVSSLSADSSVSVHINDLFINTPRLYETQFYDVESIEVLLGPQGTFFGRNATGGVLNIITAKANTEEDSYAFDWEYGNYNHFQINGHANFAISDNFAVRLAGQALTRDGYSTTIAPNANFEDFDDRSIASFRLSLHAKPSETVSLDVMFSSFSEDDSRVRSPKSLCEYDETGILGCLPTGLTTAEPNFSATFAGIIMSDVALGTSGAFEWGSIPDNPSSSDYREAYLQYSPLYQAGEDLLTFSLKAELSDDYHLYALLSVQSSYLLIDRFFSNPASVTVSPTVIVKLPKTTTDKYFSDNKITLSGKDPNGLGAAGGVVYSSYEGIFGYDEATLDAEQTGLEIRLHSDYEGDVNYLVGANILTATRESHYYLAHTALDYASAVIPSIPDLVKVICPSDDPDSCPSTGKEAPSQAVISPLFHIDAPEYRLDNMAVFSEVFWNITSNLNFVAALRQTRDEKYQQDRVLPLLGIGIVETDDLETALDAVANYDADPTQDGDQAYHESSATFSQTTGRLGVDFNFDSFTTLSVSLSRGYKSGGFNSSVDNNTLQVGDVFEPEIVDALEINFQKAFLDSGVFTKFTLFAYDYQDLQVGKVQERTALNENVRAQILGFEGMVIWQIGQYFTLSTMVSMLNTEIRGGTSEDPRDPTGGESGHVILKDALTGGTCIIQNATGAEVKALDGIPLFQKGLGYQYAYSDVLEIPGVGDGLVVATCQQDVVETITGFVNDQRALLPNYVGADAVAEPVLVNLTGNELPNSPDLNVGLGLIWTRHIGGGFIMDAGGEVYWQDEMYGRIYNNPATDIIEPWMVVNAQVSLSSEEEGWKVRLFVKNLLDDDNVTGHSVSSPDKGLDTSLFLLEPRLIGVGFHMKF